MYFEQVFGDRIYLCFTDDYVRDASPRVVALGHKGYCFTSDEYKFGEDYVALEAFKEAYELKKPERKEP